MKKLVIALLIPFVMAFGLPGLMAQDQGTTTQSSDQGDEFHQYWSGEGEAVEDEPTEPATGSTEAAAQAGAASSAIAAETGISAAQVAVGIGLAAAALAGIAAAAGGGGGGGGGGGTTSHH